MTAKSHTKDTDPWTDLPFDDLELQNLLDKPLENRRLDGSRLRDEEQHMGFDCNVGNTWIYPTNLPCRSYQLSIVQAALYRNTLVVLPTGLGKTFIAAVVMYNLFRWYPRGKVIFMAPTRPLVHQQIEACQKIVPFPKKDCVELTGKLQKAKRAELWKTKRVFFATPQVVQSDILGGQVQADEDGAESPFDDSTSANKFEFPFDSIKLIVIDEAHKAKGKYAYTEVAQAIAAKTKYFRVLALSATPGRTMEDVAEVCRNLFISHVEVRWDSSIDVLPYVHKRSMETVVVCLGERIKEIREELLEIIDPYLRQLTEAGVLSGSLHNINRNFLIYEQKRYQERCLHNGRHPQHSAVSSNFAICISLYHSLELLERHGLRVFLNNFEEDIDGKGKFVLQMDRRLKQMVERLNQEMGANPFNVSAGPMTNGQIAEMPKDLDFGHPKFEKARECLIRHFQANEASRAIVFCEYRESVLLIYRMLLQHVPLLRPRCFVGQGGTGALRALTQKQQLQIMTDFRSGKSNILIATSIGEEGIDVGEVDLIVCFDISTSNPTRFVQRIGRTGRKKNGNVVMLVTEGREQQLLKEVLSSKDQTNKKILRSSVVQHAMYKHAPRLVPTEFKPQCVQTFITPCDDDQEEEEKEAAKSKKVTPKKSGIKGKVPVKGVQDLRKFFGKKPAPVLDAEDMEYFEIDTNMTQAKPGVHTQQKMEKSFDQMKNLFKDLQSPLPTQTQRKMSSHRPSISKETPQVAGDLIDLCDDSPNDSAEDVSPRKRKKVEQSQGSIKDFFKDLNESLTSASEEEVTPQETGNTEKMKALKVFMDKTLTTTAVLKRAAINDLSYHLQSKEMSDDMKYVLLTCHPDYVRENLEQMQVLSALQDLDTSSETADERAIKEIHRIIVQLFGGLEQVETYLQDLEMGKFKEDSLTNDISSDESDSEDEKVFQQKLDKIFGDLGEPLKAHETFDWFEEEFKKSFRYQEMEKAKTQAIVQESMVYDTFVNTEEEQQMLNNIEDMSFTESKYCSQWQEFNKPDIAFKSTPVQGTSNKFLNLGGVAKKTSLLTKLEEVNEEESIVGDMTSDQVEDKALEVEANTSVNTSGKFLDSLLMCEKALNTMLLQRKQEEQQSKECGVADLPVDDDDSSCRDSVSTTGSLAMMETENIKTPNILSSTAKEETMKNVTDCMADDDDDVIFLAALDAELKFTQNKAKEEDPDKTPDDLNIIMESAGGHSLNNHNSSVKLTPPSLNSTPDIIEANFPPPNAKVISNLPTPPEISIQHELDVDMEAFMEPFPEEQQLIKASGSSTPTLHGRRESLKETLAKDCMTRQSPDLFADEHSRSPNLLHVKANNTRISLASKLSAKLNVPPRCQSSLNPSTSTANFFCSPQKTLFSSKSTIQFTSPTHRLSTDKQNNDKSPSLFDMYLQNGKGKVHLPKTLMNTSLCLGTSRTSSMLGPAKHTPVIAATQNDSPVVVRKPGSRAPKRKIFDSDTEESDDGKDLTVISMNGDDDDGDSDFEVVAATQAPVQRVMHHRRKRRRFNSFIEQEAGVSGSDNSEDEAEHSVGCYMLDSVVVQSDDEDVDQASTSHMQGMYLQSLKSPQSRRGAFKIPPPRVYNDHSHIFSQALLPEEICSQYMPDSFIVDEDDNHNVTEVSMCPLERAEKILKERRRAKKNKQQQQQQQLDIKTNSQTTKRKKKILILDDSSDDEFV